MNYRRQWTKEDDALLKKKYKNTDTQDLATELKRTTNAVRGRAEKLGLKKTAKFLEANRAKFDKATKKMVVWTKNGGFPNED